MGLFLGGRLCFFVLYVVAKNRLGLGDFLGFHFWDFSLLSFLFWKTSDVRIQKKNQALFLGCAEQLRAASQYSLVSIERSFFVMLQCLGAEEEKKLLWLFELRNFFICLLVQNFGPKFFYISCREDVEIVRVRGGVFCLISVFLFLCLLFFSVSSSAWKISDPCALEPHKKIRETTKPFVYNCKGGWA